MDIEGALDAIGATETPPETQEADPETVETTETEVEVPAEGDEATQEGEKEAEHAEKPSKTEPEKAKEPSTDELFTDKALSTPEGIKKAREVTLEERQRLFKLQRKLDGIDIRQKERAKKFDQTKETWLRDRRQDEAFVQDVRNTVQLIRTGSAAQRVEALGRLTGQTGQKAYEELSFGIIHDGKKQTSPEFEAMQQQIQGLYGVIDRLVQGTQQQQQQAEHQRTSAFVQQRLGEMVEAGKDATAYPHLADFIAAGREQEVRDYLQEIYDEHGKTVGTVLDDAQALGRIERELTQALGARAAKPTSLGTPQKPGGQQAQRTPAHKAIPPSLAGRSRGAVRDMTDDERLDELSRDPEFLSAFGR